MELLQLRDISKVYKKNKAVDGLSFSVNRGEVFGLIGSNGAGKSTTISMIATLTKPDEGDIFFEGQSVLNQPRIIREKLGYVPQDIALYTSLSGIDNLIFWGKSYHIKKEELPERIYEVMDITGLTQEQLAQRVDYYSGGMKRRLNIGVALLHRPPLVIMDEPTVGIDVFSRNHILNTIKRLKTEGTTVIYVGHYMEEMEQICDRICIMDKGRAVVTGDMKQLLSEQRGNTRLEDLYLRVVH